MKMMEKPSQPAPPPQPPSTAMPPTRTTLTDEEIEKIDKEGLVSKWKELEQYVVFTLEKKAGDKLITEKLTLQQQEATRRENVLMMRLATKEQEMQELLAQIQELKQAQTPSAQQLQTMLIDPAVNLLFEKMKTELMETKDRLEQAQNDLSAWKFTPDSVTGKKLMAKCRTLIQENQELGKQLSQGRIAQLEAELSLQKKYSEELKGSQDEMNEFVIQLDEEVEGMQATICALQQQLKESKLLSDKLTSENQGLKAHVEELLKQASTAHINGMSAVGTVQDVSMNESLEHSSVAPCTPSTQNGSPEKSGKVERTSKRDAALSPSSRRNSEAFSPPPTSKHGIESRRSSRHDSSSEQLSREEPMSVDVVKRHSTRSHSSSKVEQPKDTCETTSTRAAKTVKVITQQSAALTTTITTEASKLTDSGATSPHVSPPKNVLKTSSFSISDLLSSAVATDCVRKDGEPLVTAGAETDEQMATTISVTTTATPATQPLMNGEIDDSAI